MNHKDVNILSIQLENRGA
jgi:hypothetical protein